MVLQRGVMSEDESRSRIIQIPNSIEGIVVHDHCPAFAGLVELEVSSLVRGIQ